jgi:hypothetical protein
MLHQVLQAFEQTEGPVQLDELSRRLGIERSALDGMIAFWVRKGRLKDSALEGCGGGCAAHCGGTSSCSFQSHTPRTIELVTPRSK